MPDRKIIAFSPQEGMIFRYERNGVSWVVMIERVMPFQITWLWRKGIRTLQEANACTRWDEDPCYSRKEWEQWLTKLDEERYGSVEIELLTPEFRPEVQISWEV